MLDTPLDAELERQKQSAREAKLGLGLIPLQSRPWTYRKARWGFAYTVMVAFDHHELAFDSRNNRQLAFTPRRITQLRLPLVVSTDLLIRRSAFPIAFPKNFPTVSAVSCAFD
jgi:hypothetical protein